MFHSLCLKTVGLSLFVLPNCRMAVMSVSFLLSPIQSWCCYMWCCMLIWCYPICMVLSLAITVSSLFYFRKFFFLVFRFLNCTFFLTFQVVPSCSSNLSYFIVIPLFLPGRYVCLVSPSTGATGRGAGSAVNRSMDGCPHHDVE